jgi:hypothetical protein
MQFRVVVIVPPGWQHGPIFSEVAETLVLGLRAIGHKAMAAVNQFAPDALNIVMAGFHLTPADFDRIPPRTVVYNLEQLGEDTFRRLPDLMALFRRFEVWDYSERNIERLRGIAPRLFHLPVGMVPELTRIVSAAPQDQDIDVFFYGALTERRQEALRRIAAAGLRVRSEFGVYGAARDALIARAKVILNLHKQAAEIFEVVRVSYLLANRKAVVSEISDFTELPEDLKDAVHGVPYDGLAEACRALVADDAARQALAERGYRRMTARQAPVLLRKLLNQRAKSLSRR